MVEIYWTKERINLLQRLYTSGMPTSKIAERLGGGVSRNAVIGKVNRLRLKAGGGPEKFGKHPMLRKAKNPTPEPAKGKRAAKRAVKKAGGAAKPKRSSKPKAEVATAKPTPKRTAATTQRTPSAAKSTVTKPERNRKASASGVPSAGRMSKFSRRKPSKVSARASLRKPSVKSVAARQAAAEKKPTAKKSTSAPKKPTKQTSAKPAEVRARSALRVAPGKKPRASETPRKSAARLSGAVRRARNRVRAQSAAPAQPKLKVKVAKLPATGQEPRSPAAAKAKPPKAVRKRPVKASRKPSPASIARTRKELAKPAARTRSKAERKRTATSVRVRTRRAKASKEAPASGATPLEVSEPVVSLPPRMIEMAELTETVCRWPVGDPREPGFGFCGNPVAPRKVYCQEHADLAYQPLTPRRERTRGK